jgi:hypothetical protein
MLAGVAVLALGPALLKLLIPRNQMAGAALCLGIDFLVLAYYAVFLRSILHASMDGREELPLWPEMSHPTDLAEEFFSIVAPFIVSFFPLILLRASIVGIGALQSLGFIVQSALPVPLSEASPWTGALSALLLIGGWLYLPMAILVWVFYGGSSILNPIAVARSAWRTGPSYLLLVLLVAAMVMAAWGVSVIPGNFITTLGTWLLTFYALVVAMRLLGTHYLIHREDLGWEAPRAPEPL